MKMRGKGKQKRNKKQHFRLSSRLASLLDDPPPLYATRAGLSGASRPCRRAPWEVVAASAGR